ncbi:copper resistance protein NlpE N-terminal domain-containing protein [Campylobacter sp. RM9344]|uniref:Copper resistance protein NlpE N-terminal domain-containing protein n=1 Tax=Campylobacter californiensis TaxID=1032243 RepID=A0AAW3ZXX3_9BACT|nr:MULTISPECIES: copper resistance protein NlpE [unclassified Campylobacter]MBE2984819.1 copper resistance protein NlpE N-terminal domain-containing protein [Campylobacter sp. RM6883]MBE2986523.1 copper resistance protein NlpE N-terminal domain-containing protein [Campylobacter sp. RM12919]MBE2987723.1 copper resistance protein NlpE N-terminal domain-containing protein [Campylobacter sp. RM12920]MBE2994715.1 copper resistance protein NlpE N-terminal domain-containing protein [Campylobacter sp. 
MKKFKFITLLASAIFMAGCSSFNQHIDVPKGETCTIDDDKNKAPKCEIKSIPVAGIYKATLPCASCEAIETTLNLNADGSFTCKMTYKGNQDYTDLQYGKYEIAGDIVTTTDEYKEKMSYKFDGTNLHLLDFDGNVAKGEFKDLYTFKKSN